MSADKPIDQSQSKTPPQEVETSGLKGHSTRSISSLAQTFKEKSKIEVESIEKAAKTAFQSLEKNLIAESHSNQKRLQKGIQDQNRSLLEAIHDQSLLEAIHDQNQSLLKTLESNAKTTNRLALKSWKAVSIVIITMLLLSGSAVMGLGWLLVKQSKGLWQMNQLDLVIETCRTPQGPLPCIEIDQSRNPMFVNGKAYMYPKRSH